LTRQRGAWGFSVPLFAGWSTAWTTNVPASFALEKLRFPRLKKPATSLWTLMVPPALVSPPFLGVY